MSLPVSQSTARQRPAAPPSLERLILYGHPRKPRVGEVVRTLVDWARERSMALSVGREIVQWLEPDATAADKANGLMIYDEGTPVDQVADGDAAMVVCLGGDGTLIHAARRFWSLGAPMMGVNLGSLGFNASVEPGRATAVIEEWLEGRGMMTERLLLRARHERGEETLATAIAINDAVLTKHSDARILQITLRQGRDIVSAYGADGLILSTPTGSTAYNLSAGGPIVHPALRVLIATAICPHTLATRPVVLPPDPPVSVQFLVRDPRDTAIAWIDGQERWKVAAGDRITLDAVAEPLRLVCDRGADYFATLRRKLHWSGQTSSGLWGDSEKPAGAEDLNDGHENPK